MQKRIKKYSFILATLLAMPSFVFAMPSVDSTSGTMAHGQSVTISGSGFGSHADYNNLSDTWQGKEFLPFRWKTFEDGVAASDGFTQNCSYEPEIITGHVNYGASFEDNASCSNRRLIALTTNNSGSSGVWFTSFWFKVVSWNLGVKFFRLYLGPNSSQDNFYLATAGTDLHFRAGNEAGGTSVTGSPDDFVTGTWHKVEVYATASTGNLNVAAWLDGTQQWSKTNWGPNLVYSPDGHSIDFGHLLDTGTVLQYDDIYVDYTQARVEICSGSSWSSRGTCEIQVPSAWSDVSATITINQGSFADASNQYLYVVDSNGDTNSGGYPLTFSGTSDTVSPANPSGLSVV